MKRFAHQFFALLLSIMLLVPSLPEGAGHRVHGPAQDTISRYGYEALAVRALCRPLWHRLSWPSLLMLVNPEERTRILTTGHWFAVPWMHAALAAATILLPFSAISAIGFQSLQIDASSLTSKRDPDPLLQEIYTAAGLDIPPLIQEAVEVLYRPAAFSRRESKPSAKRRAEIQNLANRITRCQHLGYERPDPTPKFWAEQPVLAMELLHKLAGDLDTFLAATVGKLHQIQYSDPAQRRQILQELTEVHARLAERLGYRELSRWIEDSALLHANPEAFLETRTEVQRQLGGLSRDEQSHWIRKLQQVLDLFDGPERRALTRLKSTFASWIRQRQPLPDPSDDTLGGALVVSSKQGANQMLQRLHAVTQLAIGKTTEKIRNTMDDRVVQMTLKLFGFPVPVSIHIYPQMSIYWYRTFGFRSHFAYRLAVLLGHRPLFRPFYPTEPDYRLRWGAFGNEVTNPWTYAEVSNRFGRRLIKIPKGGTLADAALAADPDYHPQGETYDQLYRDIRQAKHPERPQGRPAASPEDILKDGDALIIKRASRKQLPLNGSRKTEVLFKSPAGWCRFNRYSNDELKKFQQEGQALLERLRRDTRQRNSHIIDDASFNTLWEKRILKTLESDYALRPQGRWDELALCLSSNNPHSHRVLRDLDELISYLPPAMEKESLVEDDDLPHVTPYQIRLLRGRNAITPDTINAAAKICIKKLEELGLLMINPDSSFDPSASDPPHLVRILDVYAKSPFDPAALTDILRRGLHAAGDEFRSLDVFTIRADFEPYPNTPSQITAGEWRRGRWVATIVSSLTGGILGLLHAADGPLMIAILAGSAALAWFVSAARAAWEHESDHIDKARALGFTQVHAEPTPEGGWVVRGRNSATSSDEPIFNPEVRKAGPRASRRAFVRDLLFSLAFLALSLWAPAGPTWQWAFGLMSLIAGSRTGAHAVFGFADSETIPSHDITRTSPLSETEEDLERWAETPSSNPLTKDPWRAASARFHLRGDATPTLNSLLKLPAVRLDLPVQSHAHGTTFHLEIHAETPEELDKMKNAIRFRVDRHPEIPLASGEEWLVPLTFLERDHDISLFFDVMARRHVSVLNLLPEQRVNSRMLVRLRLPPGVLPDWKAWNAQLAALQPKDPPTFQGHEATRRAQIHYSLATTDQGAPLLEVRFIENQPGLLVHILSLLGINGWAPTGHFRIRSGESEGTGQIPIALLPRYEDPLSPEEVRDLLNLLPGPPKRDDAPAPDDKRVWLSFQLAKAHESFLQTLMPLAQRGINVLSGESPSFSETSRFGLVELELSIPAGIRIEDVRNTLLALEDPNGLPLLKEIEMAPLELDASATGWARQLIDAYEARVLESPLDIDNRQGLTLNQLLGTGVPDDVQPSLNALLESLKIADWAHEGATRKSDQNRPYLVHLANVARQSMDDDFSHLLLLNLSLLHDSEEDIANSRNALQRQLGLNEWPVEEWRQLLHERMLNDIPGFPRKLIRDIALLNKTYTGYSAALKGLREADRDYLNALKLLDQLDNLRTVWEVRPEYKPDAFAHKNLNKNIRNILPILMMDPVGAGGLRPILQRVRRDYLHELIHQAARTEETPKGPRYRYSRIALSLDPQDQQGPQETARETLEVLSSFIHWLRDPANEHFLVGVDASERRHFEQMLETFKAELLDQTYEPALTTAGESPVRGWHRISRFLVWIQESIHVVAARLTGSPVLEKVVDPEGRYGYVAAILSSLAQARIFLLSDPAAHLLFSSICFALAGWLDRLPLEGLGIQAGRLAVGAAAAVSALRGILYAQSDWLQAFSLTARDFQAGPRIVVGRSGSNLHPQADSPEVQSILKNHPQLEFALNPVRMLLKENPVLRPVFLLALDQKNGEVGELEIIHPFMFRQLGGHERFNRYSLFKLNGPRAAEQQLALGREILVGVTDRRSTKTLIRAYDVASRRQVYIPLPDGSWLGIIGVGQLTDDDSPPYGNKLGELDYGLLPSKERVNASLLNPLIGTGLRMGMPIAQRPLLRIPLNDNRWIDTSSLRGDRRRLISPMLGFVRYLSPHRLVKFPQILNADVGLSREAERLSPLLAAEGYLDPDTSRLWSADQRLTGEKLIRMIFHQFGYGEAIKQNLGLAKNSFHAQDLTLAGEETDFKELLSFEEYGNRIQSGYWRTDYIREIDKTLFIEHGVQIRDLRTKLHAMFDMYRTATEYGQGALLFPRPLDSLQSLFSAYFQTLAEHHLRHWAGPTDDECTPALRAVTEETPLSIFDPAGEGFLGLRHLPGGLMEESVDSQHHHDQVVMRINQWARNELRLRELNRAERNHPQSPHPRSILTSS